jgi:hypothetical protein
LLWVLWARPAGAQARAEQPTTTTATDEQSTDEQSAAATATDEQPKAPATEQSNTVLLGFREADGRAAELQVDELPDSDVKGWFTLCFAPCTRRVPADARFRAIGPLAEPSEPFRLPAGKDRVIATAMDKKPPHTAPKVMVGVGVVSVLIGPLVAVVGLIKGMSGQDGYGYWMGTGAVMTVGGAISAIAGAVWLANTSSDRQAVVNVARSTAPHLALPGGIGLDSRGFTF